MKRKPKPLQIERIKYGKTILTIDPPITIQPEHSHILLIAHEPVFNMHLWGSTRTEIRRAAEDEIIFLWEYYAKTDEKLSKDAKKLRRVLLKRIKEEVK